ncbi:S-layer family protein, partial [Methanosphaera sp. WGK6]|uniref:beta strand repeat-containing protein n=1 Tax=Methanosphaera sp. WGK6 TaxID=1561964 RepID=UPI00086966C9
DDVTIYGRNSTLDVVITNNTIGNTTINVTVIDSETNKTIPNADVIVTLPNGTNITGKTDENGNVNVPVDIPVGENNITVIYNGDDTYKSTNTTVTVNVEKRESDINAAVSNNTAGNVTIDVTVTDLVNGTPITSGNIIITTENGTIVGKGSVDTDGDATIITNITNSGVYDLIITYEGNENYTESSTLVNDVSVVGRESEVIASVLNNTVGNTTIEINLHDFVTGEPIYNADVTITLPNGTEIVAITGTDGKVNVTMNLSVGENTIIVKFNGDETYNASSTTVDISSVKRDSSTSANIVNNTAGNVTVNVTVVDAITGEMIVSGNVSVIDNNGNIIGNGSIVDGNAIIVTNITQTGDYTLNVSYNGNEEYMGSSTILNDVNVIGRDTNIDVVITNNTVGNTTINVTVIDSETNKTIPNADVIVTLPNGTNITGKTDENGNLSISVDLPVGNNDLNVTYPGDETYNGTNTTVNVNVGKRNSSTSASVVNNTAGNVTVNVVVTDAINGNMISSGDITIRDDTGSIIGTGSIVDGNAVIITNIIQTGDYTLNVSYSGNEEYTGSSTILDDVNVIGRDTNIDVVITNNTVGNTTINVTVIDSETNETIPNADVIVTLPNGTNITGKTDENGSVIIPIDVPVGDNNITVTYVGNETYDETSTTVNVNVTKIHSIIVVDSVIGVIGENITLIAYVTDEYGNPITGGNLVFKLNGKTLRIDGSFNSTAAPLKFSVVNGTVTYTLTADLYLRNAKNLSASYSGSKKYTENISQVTTVQIAKRTADITVTTINTTKQDNDIELTATLTDTTRNGTNITAINEGYVVFKVNGISLKDMDGNTIRVKVENNTAKYIYHVSAGMASVDGQGNLRNYTVETVYQSDIFYPDARNTTTFHVEKSNITLNIDNILINNTTKTITTISGNITDYNGNLVVGTNKVCVKVNGKTLRDNNNDTMYFTVTNGNINLTNINTTGIKSFNNITIVTGERQAYNAGRNTTTQLTIV